MEQGDRAGPVVNLEIDQWFNLVEGVLWVTFAAILAVMARKTTRQRRIVMGASLTLLFFGISDFIEIVTRAWYAPWPLFALKAACCLSLLGHAMAFHRRRSGTPDS